jgi:zinc transporter 2
MTTSAARSKLVKATGLAFTFMSVEIVGGYLAHSLAVLTDAAHLLSDVAGFAISLFCLTLAEKHATSLLSFGFKRAEVLGALLSVSLIWVVTALLLVEAASRALAIVRRDPNFTPVNGKLMFFVASFGLVANLLILRILGGQHGHAHGGGSLATSSSVPRDVESAQEEEVASPHHGGASHSRAHNHSHGSHDSHDAPGSHDAKDDADEAHDFPASEGSNLVDDVRRPKRTENINVTSAYVHAIGDVAQSVAVMLSASVIWIFPPATHPMVQLVDPFATVLFSLVVAYSTAGITKTSLHVLMQGVPYGFDPKDIKLAIERVALVVSVHELHFWSLSVDDHFLSAHVVVHRLDPATLPRIRAVLGKLGIRHSSIQLEEQSCSHPAVNACHSYGATGSR